MNLQVSNFPRYERAFYRCQPWVKLQPALQAALWAPASSPSCRQYLFYPVHLMPQSLCVGSCTVLLCFSKYCQIKMIFFIFCVCFYVLCILYVCLHLYIMYFMWKVLYYNMNLFFCLLEQEDWGFPGGSVVKNLLACRRFWFDHWVRKIPWRRKMVTHSSILAWRIPWMEEPGGLQSLGLQRVGHDLVTLATKHTHSILPGWFC